jgi:hypothetical protein
MSKPVNECSSTSYCLLAFSDFTPLAERGSLIPFGGSLYELNNRWVAKSVTHDGMLRVRVEGKLPNKRLIEIAVVLCPHVDFWDVDPDPEFGLFRSVSQRK